MKTLKGKEANKHKVFFPNLDGIRFFCFFAVFLMHSFVTDDLQLNSSSSFVFLRVHFFNKGHLGVNFFFVLSGFLITFLLLKEKEYTSSIHVGNFYIRRILRIWPLYFFNVFFGFLVFPYLKTLFGGVASETADYRFYLAFISNFDMLKHGLADASMLNVLWSVAVEEQFYLIWPLLLLVTPSRHYIKLLLGIIVLSFVFRCFHYQDGPVLHLHTLASISDMAVGGLAATLAIRNKSFLEWITTLPRGFNYFLYGMLIVLFIFRTEIFSGFGATIDRLVFSIVFALIILEQNYAQRSLFKLKNYKFITNAGKYTYGLYCLHMIGILITTTLLRKAGLGHHLWEIALIQVPVSLLFSLVIARASFFLIEKRILKLKDKFAVITKS